MSTPWYADGLQFACTQCGNCCTGQPGFVWVTDTELAEIAQFRNEPVEQVVGLYTRLERQRRSLKEKANNDCIFYDREKGCTIYPVRPVQCRTWPFWESNVRSPGTWALTAEGCPGCNQGDLISIDEITARVRATRL